MDNFWEVVEVENGVLTWREEVEKADALKQRIASCRVRIDNEMTSSCIPGATDWGKVADIAKEMQWMANSLDQIRQKGSAV